MGHDRRLPRYFVALAVFTATAAGALFSLGLAAGSTPPGPDPAHARPSVPGAVSSFEEQWEQVERLISEDKYQAAAEAVSSLLEDARAGGSAEWWTRCLIREVQLRTGLHGYETAVRFLAEEEWPADPTYRSVLHLYLGHSLVLYLRRYSWEIQQREQVTSDQEVDLRAWTRSQIVHRASLELLAAWSYRDEWGTKTLGDLAEYFVQNDYPPRIRGTLRDAVTYLWTDLLADSSLWSPAASHDLYQLEVAALAAALPVVADAALLADPDVHPLRKLAALLGDLEAWHREGERPEAGFEARRARLERLAQHFTRNDDRATLRTALRAALDRLGRRYEWWSVGTATLAEMVRQLPGSDALVRARAIALEGMQAHPGSVGGRRCRHLVAAIEAPSFQLSSMSSDGPARRSLLVEHQNLDALHLRAYRVDLLARIDAADDNNLLPAQQEISRLVSGERPTTEWTVRLPPTPDYRSHRSWITPPMQEPGLYVVVASARRDFAEQGNLQQAVNLLLGDLVLITRGLADGWEVTLRSGRSGGPLADAAVDLYRYDWRRGHRRVRTLRTGPDGWINLSLDPRRGRERYFLVARYGDQLALDQDYLYHHVTPAPAERTAALIFTDRSVYRPGQEVRWKALAYHGGGRESRFELLPGQRFTVELVDPNGQVAASAAVVSNAFGTASASLVIPAGRLPGSWLLRSTLGGATPLRVEEYKRPTFEVEIADPDEPLRLNHPASLRGSARYYFGLPVAAGEVSWQVVREPLFPSWWGWCHPLPESSSQTVAAGSGRLGQEGGFTLAFTPEADEREAREGVTYRYRLSVQVTDEGGETRTADRAFRLGFVAVEARLEPAAHFFRGGSPVTVTVHRTDLQGVPRGGSGRWRLLRVEQPATTLLPADQPAPRAPGEEGYRTAGDDLRPRWDAGYSPEAVLRSWREGAEVASGRVEHGVDGDAVVELGKLPTGAYRLRYSTDDAYGTTFDTQTELLVVEPGATTLALPALLLAEKGSVPVGGTARFLVHSGLPHQPLVVEVWRGSWRVDRRVLGSDAGPQLVEIPVGAEQRGGFGVTLTALRDHQLMTGQAGVQVPWDDRRLQVEFATFRDRLRPGDRERWAVTVRGPEGAPLARGAAEVLAYMYDRSLDLFAPHTPLDPLSLYPSWIATPLPTASLGPARRAWYRDSGFFHLPGYPSLHGDWLAFLPGYGIGGLGRGAVTHPRADGQLRALGYLTVTAESPDLSPRAIHEGTVAEEKVEKAPAPAAGAITGAEPETTLRTDFAETAFFRPHLLTAADGSVSFEFEVPDSVTEWSVWVHAVTRDLRAGSANRRTRSVKELMVRPYLPRFLREGDRAFLKVVVNNAGDTPLAGTVDFSVEDPETGKNLLADFGLTPELATGLPFAVEPQGGDEITVPVLAPRRVGSVAVRVVARAGSRSDGELHPLPLLPGRVHLAQSRFAVLKDRDRKVLRFSDLAAGADPTLGSDQLVVTVDGQLFYSVLAALPYLVDYPYECTEQTLNRFLSTGIVSTLYDRYPAVAAMARKLSARDTRYEAWRADDPNRRMALEETPWLVTARGGAEAPEELVKVLVPEVAAAQRRDALGELQRAQTSSGGFPWWPGGPPSPYMTAYLLSGLSRALEFGIEVPKPMVVAGWHYLHRHYLDELVRHLVRDDCCWELVTYIGYVLSSYPDDSWSGGVFTAEDRARMLDFSFRHWRGHSPLLKAYLALTLHRSVRDEDAALVFDSIMDSAKTDEVLGTYWAPEERAWLWYNDTVETQAFVLRALTELDPADPRRDGLVQWLLLDKKLAHWKSTRATAEAIYALVHYLEQEGTLGAAEAATVAVGPRSRTFSFSPDAYTGKGNQLVVPGPEVEPSMAAVKVSKETPGLLFASATWHFSTERIPEEVAGDLFAVSRSFFVRRHDGRAWTLTPLSEGEPLHPGDEVEVHLSITARHAAECVHLRDPRGAGFEPATLTSGYRYNLGIGRYEAVRDSGTDFFFEWLPAGEYTLKHRLRVALAGTFKVAPATLQSMYAPEFTAYSSGSLVEVATD